MTAQPSPWEWVKLLYDGVTPPAGAVEFRILPGSRQVFMPWPCPAGMPGVFTAAQIPRMANTYMGVSLRRDSSSGKGDNVHPTHLVWADFDMKGTPSVGGQMDVQAMEPDELREAARQLMAALLERCAALGLLPRAIVYTGHGLQVYWARRVRSTTADTERYNRALVATFGEATGADSKTVDAARIFRLPGSVNVKNKARPLPVEVWLQDADAWAEDKALDALPDPKARPAPVKVKRAAQPAGGSALERYVQRALADECAAVSSTGEGGRNDALNRAAFNLGTLVGAGALDEQHAAQELTVAAEAAGLSGSEIRDTVRSGLSAGVLEPRDLSRVGHKPQASAAGIDVGTLPTPDAIPAAEHWTGEEKADYSDRQVLELLGLNGWPVTAPDTDTAHAHRLVKLADGDLRYSGKLGGNLAFTGQRWTRGNGRKLDGEGDLLAFGWAQKLSRTMGPEVARLFALRGVLAPVESRKRDSEAMERAAWRHVRAQKSAEGHIRQRAILEAARPLMMVDHALFEPRPWVLGFQNGVWDTGQWREHRREDYMLSLTPVEYRPDADPSDWHDVLKRITGGDADLARGLQDVAGYALSGASTLRLLPWLYGPKGTGKSTFAELLGTLLGDMAANLDTKLFAADGARERLGAAVWGKRAVLCAEAGNARLDAELLKTLSGGDRLPVRFLFSEGFTATPRHVLLMVANDAPRVEAYDDALKDRVLALPFLHPLHAPGLPELLGGQRIEAVRQDPGSPLVLGFTAWAVEGMAQVLRTGRVHRSAASARATAQFWADVDPLREFWQDMGLEAFAVVGVKASDLRSQYTTWAEQMGVRPYAMKKWGQACAAVGLESVKRTGGMRYWTLKTPDLFPTDDANQGADAGADPERSGASGATEAFSNSYMEKTPLFRGRVEESENGSTAPLAPLAPASGEL